MTVCLPIASSAMAQTPPISNVPAQGIQADFGYTRGSGSGGFTSNALTSQIDFVALPVALGLDATQNLVDGVESSTQVGTDLTWRVTPLFSVTANLSTSNDELLNVSGRGLAVAWKLNRLWQGERVTRVAWQRDLYDYSLQSGAAGVGSRIPQQQRTRLDLRQGLTPTLEASISVDLYDYSRDPMDLARALLNRKVRRVGMANKLGDLLDRSHSLGLSWSPATEWNLDLSTTQSATVVGQNQRLWSAALSHVIHPRASVSIGYSDGRTDALVTPAGLVVSPQQNDSTVELGVKWLY